MNQKGFIQIPILIAIIVGVLVLSGAGYFGIKQYQNYQVEKVAREEKARALAEDQSKALQESQQEIERLKQEGEEAKEKQTALEQKVSAATKATPKDLSISASEIAPYLSGVANVDCDSKGSGSLWNLPVYGYTLLTNKHLVSPNSSQYCAIVSGGGDFYLYSIDLFKPYWAYLNKDLDIAAYPLEEPEWTDNKYRLSVQEANYKISSLRKCSTEMQLGSPVVVIGFPASTQQKVFVPGFGMVPTSNRTVTNGIISAHDASSVKPLGNLLYKNYFVSAKIDSGNSGGIALSKDVKGLCILGVPTWLSIGNYETQGVVQNIHNVLR